MTFYINSSEFGEKAAKIYIYDKFKIRFPGCIVQELATCSYPILEYLFLCLVTADSLAGSGPGTTQAAASAPQASNPAASSILTSSHTIAATELKSGIVSDATINTMVSVKYTTTREV